MSIQSIKLTSMRSRDRSANAHESFASGENVMRNAINIRLLPAALLLAMPMLAAAAGKPPQVNGLTNTCIGQNFDGVVAPALPANWTTTVVGAPTTVPWVTRAVGYSDTGPNAAFLDDALDYADSSLYSATYSVTSSDIPYVVFHHSFVLWSPDASSLNNGSFNGGVLEVSIDGGSFVDIVASGGAFYGSGGYNAHLDTKFENPIDQPPAGRAVWSGDSGGFITTTAIIPPTAVGHKIQLRWRLGTSGGSRSYDTHSGWWVDSVQTQALATVSDYIFTDRFDNTNCTL
jgi:hypothetical protein